jgi:hypothetical protein
MDLIRGTDEEWNDGIMELWKKWQSLYSIIPSFHYSNIPTIHYSLT